MLPLVALWNEDTALASTGESPAVASVEFSGGLASGVHCVSRLEIHHTWGWHNCCCLPVLHSSYQEVEVMM